MLRNIIFPLNVVIVTAKRYYRYRGIIASCLPSPWHYRDIFPISVVITAVTAVLPLSPLPCHPPGITYSRRQLRFQGWTLHS